MNVIKSARPLTNNLMSTQNLRRCFSKVRTDTSEQEANREKGLQVENYSYNVQRRAYLQEVAQYRRKFAFDYKRKQEKLKKDKEAERLKIQQAKDARLELKRARIAENAKRAAAELEERLAANAIRFEEKALVRNQVEVERNNRRLLILESTKLHGQKWVSNDNIEDKLGEAFFEQSGVQVASEGWKPSNRNNENPRSWLERLHRMAPRNSRQKETPKKTEE